MVKLYFWMYNANIYFKINSSEAETRGTAIKYQVRAPYKNKRDILTY